MIENLKLCIEKFEEDSDEWELNIISHKAVQGPSGALGYPGTVDAIPNEEALQKCQTIADEACQIATNLTVVDSEGSEEFQPYYVANHDGWSCTGITKEMVFQLFGETLYAEAEVTIEPINSIDYPYDDEDIEAQWEKLIEFFEKHPGFVETAFIKIHSNTLNDKGCFAFPRLLIGRMEDGSVAGLFGVSIWS